MDALRALAQFAGIQVSYVDMSGQRHHAAPEALRAILNALGIPAGSLREVGNSLREHQFRRAKRLIEPVTVAWDGEEPVIELTVPAERNRDRFECRIHLEGGGTRRLSRRLDELPASRIMELGRSVFLVKQLVLPSLPFGYHRVELELHSQVSHGLIISAPSKCYALPGSPKVWGGFLPMYALRSKQSWGAGNLSDFRALGKWVAGQGGGVLGTLPLLAAFMGSPCCEPSPYSPVSRLFWNEFYVDVPSIPEFGRCKQAQAIFNSSGFQKALRAARSSRLVDYQAEMELRRRVLTECARFLLAQKSSRRKEFLDFVKQRPLLQEYSRFRATCDRKRSSWQHWEPRLREGKFQDGDYSEADNTYHGYAQWIAQQQMDDLVADCRKQDVRLYLDLPVGVHPDGFDVWREQNLFATGASVGAPPDIFFTKGQDWGFPPLHPERLRESGFRYVIEYLRFQMRHARVLRIDHVMGLHRLYWTPRGTGTGQGAYVTYPAEELHAILCLESQRHETVLIGENLGIVPPEVTESMFRHGFGQTYVAQFEQREDWKQALRTPPKKAVASANTHDTPTFAAQWQGSDIPLRQDLSLLTTQEARKERILRKKLNLATAKFLKAQKLLKSERPVSRSALTAILAWLGATSAEVVLVSLEDLWDETQPQNVPGTTSEYPNWKRKAALGLEEIQKQPRIRAILARLRRARSHR
jgi:4-alpha-glucanotransferase